MDESTLVDRLHQHAYRVGHRLMRRWWALTDARTRGAFVGVWCGDEILVLQNGYVDYRSFPGGGIRRDEPPEVAAARECREEVGLRVALERLDLDFVVEHEWEGRLDTVWVYTLELEARPQIQIDRREVVAAAFETPEVALSRPLFWPLRRHIEARLARVGAGAREP